jgi:hypothetical protein
MVMIRWGQHKGGTVTARIGWDDDGVPGVIEVERKGDGWEGLPVPGPADGPMAVIAMCGGSVVRYSLDEAIEWVLSLESEDKPILPGPGCELTVGEGGSEVDWDDFSLRVTDILRSAGEMEN